MAGCMFKYTPLPGVYPGVYVACDHRCGVRRQTRRLVFLRSWQEPELLQWYQRLRAALIATFSLYFRDVLSRQASAAEFRALCAKTAADHYAR